MYKVKVEGDFSSAHSLRGYKGKCESLHGHNWKVEVEVWAEALGKIGMVVDFKLLKKRLKGILEELDHTHINGLGYFKKVNPTSENIAKYIYDRLNKTEPGVNSVTVWESENSAATYSE
jgi:6-pyruvoyltetrahydropterin/6-carboxytetrahydropterin synthase